MQLETHYKEADLIHDSKIKNWRPNNLGSSLYYSYRVTGYNRSTFPTGLHCHDYFELVFFEAGDIHYICESDTYQPKPGDAVLVPPGMFHMSMIQKDETLYKRHVFYLYPNALDEFGCGALTTFLEQADKGLAVFSMDEQRKKELLSLLPRLDKALSKSDDPACKALSIGLVIEIFFLLSQSNLGPSNDHTPLPKNLLSIKNYIDEHLCDISSIQEIADHFFYSREYVSRLFRKHFNTTVSQYITARRVAYSKNLIEQGFTISEACYKSGFENMSTFIRAFRNFVNTVPSEYRKSITAVSKGNGTL